jgi:amino acid transporter
MGIFLVLIVVGLGFLVAGLRAAPGSTNRGDGVITGTVILIAAVAVLLFLFTGYEGDGLFSDSASSVSNAPG